MANMILRQFMFLTAAFLALCSPVRADLLSLCTGPKPTELQMQDIYINSCPAYLRAQIAAQIAASEAQGITTSLSQQQTQVAILTSLAALSKTGAPAIPSGQDLSGLASAAQLKD